jgi:hypothetical protein
MLADLRTWLDPLLAAHPDATFVRASLAAVDWLTAQLAPVSVPDPSARQRGVDGLHAAWAAAPDHRAALARADATLRDAGPDGAVYADLLTALRDALAGPTPPSEAALGAALEPALRRLRDLDQAGRDAASAAQIRKAVDDRFAGFQLPFQGLPRR